MTQNTLHHTHFINLTTLQVPYMTFLETDVQKYK